MNIFLRKFFLVFKKKKNILYVDNENQISKAKQAIQKEVLLGVDTEFDWRNTYFPVLSLLQISTAKSIFLIDCLKCKDLKFFKDVLEDKNKLIIFHSARSDTTVLSTNLGVRIKKVFDIQIAEKLLTSGSIKSYSSIVSKYFGKVLDKSETNSNWLRRPLKKKQILYAAKDVEFLVEIYRIQKKILYKKNKLQDVFKESRKEAKLGNQDLKISRLNRKKNKFSQREKDIFLWREDMAKLENVPTSFLFKDKYLRKLSMFKADEENLKSKIINIMGDTKLSEKFISNFF